MACFAFLEPGFWPFKCAIEPLFSIKKYDPCLSFQELDLLDSANIVYKLIGPVLVRQDLDEAKATVAKRLEYINGEM